MKSEDINDKEPYGNINNNSGDFEYNYTKKDEYNALTNLIYVHPYFTYHCEPRYPNEYREYIPKSKVSPFSIRIYTASGLLRTFYPREIDEDTIKSGFCQTIRSLSTEKIPDFLDYQYKEFIETKSPGTNKGPVDFLQYAITTIEEDINPYHRTWHSANYYNLKAVAIWIKNHPYSTRSFGKRINNWINIIPGIRTALEEQKEFKYQEFYDLIYMNTPQRVQSTLEQQYENELKNLQSGEIPLHFFHNLQIQMNKFLPLNYKMKDSTFLCLRSVGEWINSHPGINAEIRDWSKQWLAEIGTYESFVAKKGRTNLNQEQTVTNTQQTITDSLPKITADKNTDLVAEKLRHLSGNWNAQKNHVRRRLPKISWLCALFDKE